MGPSGPGAFEAGRGLDSRCRGIVVTMYANIDLSGCETTTPREAEKKRVTKAGLSNLGVGRLNSKYCVAEGTVAATGKDLECEWPHWAGLYMA